MNFSSKHAHLLHSQPSLDRPNLFGAA